MVLEFQVVMNVWKLCKKEDAKKKKLYNYEKEKKREMKKEKARNIQVSSIKKGEAPVQKGKGKKAKNEA